MGTGNSQKITPRHQRNFTACEKDREGVFRRCLPSWIFCDGSVHRWQTWCCIIHCHLHCLAKTASSCTRGWAGGLLHAPSTHTSLVQKRDKDMGRLPSHPPASPIPALHQGKLLVSAIPGRSSSCVHIALTVPLPFLSTGGLYSLPALCVMRR